MQKYRRILQTGLATEQVSGAVHLLFDPFTGDTHFLNDLPFLLLQAIDDTPRSVSEISERLAVDEELDADAAAQINQTLLSLASSRLVESSDH
jgi:PqqD family protein of HPr-rel-A system